MKKIAIDTLPLDSGHAARGMGMYAKNLIKNIERVNKGMFEIETFNFSENQNKLSDYDLIHYPYFDLFYHTLPLSKKTKTVVTVPDVAPLLYPKYYPSGVKGKINFYLQKLALKNVNGVITLTETSKKDIVRFLDYPPEKIFPVYLAPNFKVSKVHPSEKNKVKKKFNLPDEFILYIGDVNWNKNLLRLCEAATLINKTLVIVGKSAVKTDYDKSHVENRPLVLLQKKYGKNKLIKRLGFVENDDLNVIWQMASVYCQPSLYEGFGMPVIEAMDAKVPVVASKTQALVEIAGDAAEYFDPYDIKDIKQKINFLFENKKRREKLIKNGAKRVKEFSWQKTATQTIDIYKKILSQ